MSDTFDRSQLDGKDREQLSEIASALGVKSISRMRKADLVDAIVTATGAGNGATSSANGTAAAERPRRIRSTKPATDDLAALAAEQEALDAADSGAAPDDMALIRPRRRSDAGTNGATTTEHATDHAPEGTARDADEPTTDRATNGSASDSGAESPTQAQPQRDQGQWRDDDNTPGNRRRRRRRGRDRDARPEGRTDGRPEVAPTRGPSLASAPRSAKTTTPATRSTSTVSSTSATRATGSSESVATCPVATMRTYPRPRFGASDCARVITCRARPARRRAARSIRRSCASIS